MEVKNYKLIVYLISFFDLFAIGVTFPLLDTYLKSLGLSYFTIGLINSTYSSVQILSGPIIGTWSDVSDRKSVLRITLILSSIIYLCTSFSTSIGVIFCLRFLLGIFKHTQSLSKAIICDLFAKGKQAEILSRSSAFSSIGFIVGPILGGLLSDLKNGVQWAYVFCFLIFLINIGLTSTLPSAPKKIKKIKKATWKLMDLEKILENIKKVNWAESWDSFLVRFLYGFTITFYFNNQSLYLKENFALSQKHIGYSISFYSTFSTLSAFALKYIVAYFYGHGDTSCSKRLYHFFLLMSISCFCLYFSSNLYIFLVMLVPFSMCSGILRISSMELLLENCPPDQKGAYSGVSNSIMSLARSLTPVMAGSFFDLFGGQNVMLIPAVPAFLGAALTYNLYKKLNVKVDKNKKL